MDQLYDRFKFRFNCTDEQLQGYFISQLDLFDTIPELELSTILCMLSNLKVYIKNNKTYLSDFSTLQQFQSILDTKFQTFKDDMVDSQKQSVEDTTALDHLSKRLKYSVENTLTEGIVTLKKDLVNAVAPYDQLQRHAMIESQMNTNLSRVSSELSTLKQSFQTNPLSSTIQTQHLTMSTKLDNMTKEMNVFSTKLGEAISSINATPNNEMKRKVSETYVETLLHQQLPRNYQIQNVAKIPNELDIRVITPQNLVISIDVKNWKKSVDGSETAKFRHVMDTYSTIDVGIIVSLNTQIEIYKQIHFEHIGKGKLIFFYPYAIEEQCKCLPSIIMMADAMSPFIKQTETSENQWRIMTSKLTSIISLANNVSNINIQVNSLEKSIKTLKKTIDKQKDAIDLLVTECTDTLDILTNKSCVDHEQNNEVEEEKKEEKPLIKVKTKKTKPKTK